MVTTHAQKKQVVRRRSPAGIESGCVYVTVCVLIAPTIDTGGYRLPILVNSIYGTSAKNLRDTTVLLQTRLLFFISTRTTSGKHVRSMGSQQKNSKISTSQKVSYTNTRTCKIKLFKKQTQTMESADHLTGKTVDGVSGTTIPCL